MARRAIYDRRGWVLCSCRRCYRLNYVEPHGTTAACSCSVDWTDHDPIPYHLRADAGGLTVETDALPRPIVVADDDWTAIDVDHYVDQPLDWQRAGLQQTASGYGRALTSSRVAVLKNGARRRVYVTQFSNAGTAWIKFAGVRRIVRDAEVRHAS